jgi:hypothetical protein
MKMMEIIVWNEEFERVVEKEIEITLEEINEIAKEYGRCVSTIEEVIMENLGIEVKEEYEYSTNLYEILYGEEV